VLRVDHHRVHALVATLVNAFEAGQANSRMDLFRQAGATPSLGMAASARPGWHPPLLFGSPAHRDNPAVSPVGFVLPEGDPTDLVSWIPGDGGFSEADEPRRLAVASALSKTGTFPPDGSRSDAERTPLTTRTSDLMGTELAAYFGDQPTMFILDGTDRPKLLVGPGAKLPRPIPGHGRWLSATSVLSDAGVLTGLQYLVASARALRMVALMRDVSKHLTYAVAYPDTGVPRDPEIHLAVARAEHQVACRVVLQSVGTLCPWGRFFTGRLSRKYPPISLLTGHPLEQEYDADRRLQYAYVPAEQANVTALGPAEEHLLPLGGVHASSTDLRAD